MEEQVRQLPEQIRRIQKQLSALEQKKKEESAQKKFLQPTTNPNMILTSETSFDVWYRMIMGEFASLKIWGFKELVDEKGDVNYDPDEKTTMGPRFGFLEDSYRHSICDPKLHHEMLNRIWESCFPI